MIILLPLFLFVALTFFFLVSYVGASVWYYFKISKEIEAEQSGYRVNGELSEDIYNKYVEKYGRLRVEAILARNDIKLVLIVIY